MTWLHVLASRVRGWFGAARHDADFDAELHAHLEMLVEEHTSRGLPPEDAQRMARTTLGGLTQLREIRRDQRGLPLVDTLMQDVRYALRGFRRAPGFTAVAVATLALGIGLNTTVFSLFNAIALKRLPVKDPDRVVRLERWFESDARGDVQYAFSYEEYAHYRAHSRTLSSLVGVSWPMVVAAGDEVLRGQVVSDDYFRALGISAARGRVFLPEENQTPGAHPVIVLSDACWRQRFGADPQAIGKTLTLNTTVFTVIGVAPAEFIGTGNPPQVPDFWAPLMMQAQLSPGFAWLDRPNVHRIQLFGRLAPGVTIAQAQAELQVLRGQLIEIVESHVDRDKTIALTMKPATYFGGTDDIRFQELVALLMTVVGMILLVVCANLANLLLARSTRRQKEIGVRLTLGATRSRLIRQLLTESILLAAMGGAAGIVVSIWAGELAWVAVDRVIRLTFAADVPLAISTAPDARVLTFAFALAIVTGVVFGLSPALQLSRSNPSAALKEEGSALGQGMSRSRLRRLLMGAQVAVSMAFLLSAGLLVRGLLRSGATDPGFDTRSVFMVLVNFGADAAQAAGLERRVVAQLEQTPAVTGVALVDRFPLGGTWSPPIGVERTHAAPDTLPARTLANYVSPGYFPTLNIPIRRGRNFTRAESETGAPVAIVSESTARRCWPGEDPIGKRLTLDLTFRGTWAAFDVIGVATDVRSANLSRVDPSYVYLPIHSEQVYNVMVRTDGDALTARAAVRRALGAVDASLVPTSSVVSLEDGPLRTQRLMPQAIAGFASVLAALALVLATVGIYGVTAYLVNQRVREIGIRVALGATGPAVLRLLMREGLRPSLVGGALGVAAAAGISSILRSTLISPGSPDLLFGVGAFDPITFVGLGGFLAGVAIVACYLPARRALRVDPMIALRSE